MKLLRGVLLLGWLFPNDVNLGRDMMTSVKVRPILIVMVAITVLVGLNGFETSAGEADTTEPAKFVLTENSVARGAYVLIGDLRIDARAPVASRASANRGELERCIQEGPEWLRWSDDRTTVEVVWGSKGETVLAAYCDDGVILVGGYRPVGEDNDPSRRQAWLFEMVRAAQQSPTKVRFVSDYVVGSWPHETRYSLQELQSIDPDSRRIAFLAVAENGERALLSAPFAIEGRDVPVR